MKKQEAIPDEIIQKLNWKERIIYKLSENTTVKIYHLGRIDIINKILKF